MTAMHFVTVSGEVCAVAVYEKSEGDTWVARGEHKGVAIRAEARSQEAVLTRWKEAAISMSSSSKAGARSPAGKGTKARKKPAQRK